MYKTLTLLNMVDQVVQCQHRPHIQPDVASASQVVQQPEIIGEEPARDGSFVR
jgi:hypothetical protein